MMDVAAVCIIEDHSSQKTGFVNHGGKMTQHEIYKAQIHFYKENNLQ